MQATQIIEALLFASDAPLAAEDLARGDEELDVAGVEEAVEQLRQAYEEEGHAFQIYEIAGGYQILTRPELAPYLERFETVSQPSRLSGPALEVLAIVAYRQPIGRAEIEHIRGVGSAGVLRTLQERDLVEVVGRAEGLGRPLLYGTTARFLDHFGFRSLDDLPRPEDLPVVLLERRDLEGERDASEQAAEEVGQAEEQSGEGVDATSVRAQEGDGETREANGQSLDGGREATGQGVDAEGETGRVGEEDRGGREDRPGGAGVGGGTLASAEDGAEEVESADAGSPSPRRPVAPPEGGGDEAVPARPDILDDLSDDPDEE